MTNLAIRGHKERGKEVIEILKMLGGKEVGYSGIGSRYYYYIDEYGNIAGTTELPESKTFVTYTLEEFLEKYPYKAGDKVILSDYESPLEIVGMKWEDDSIKYEVYTTNYGYWFSVDELQPYKDETWEEKADKAKALNLIGEDYCGKRFVYKIPNGYEFDCIKNDEIILKPKQPQYPKTFIEVLNFWHPDRQPEDDYQRCYKKDLIEKFQDLLYARDAYWKIAGEQMGLGKLWEPDWADTETDKFVIEIVKNTITIHDYPWNETNHLLAFPTKEMRDAFYRNFKDLIEQCKELL